ncbi:hypothetical protein Pst134EB_018291 [Puccinia striiformis f. sp. tritici]|uniref:RING-type domain-containing protein n=2 Tax=Puccinia striiformis f. sp. tritici PST-78 TaxID=1165861 RepID=A0A0L0VMV5_9BASI|nr:hypothetical protein Pst134EB_018291 [Puccinia striiformis f. sp. tritici]KNF00613.1 hypothetical protein PSTG_06029 [Puccinia striiformis f. sp. tritici PST-78]
MGYQPDHLLPYCYSKFFMMANWLLFLLLVGNTVGMRPEQQIVRFGDPDRDIEAAVGSEAVRLHSHPLPEDPSPGPINLDFGRVAGPSPDHNQQPSDQHVSPGQYKYYNAALTTWTPHERMVENGEAQKIRSNIGQQSPSLASEGQNDRETEDLDEMCAVCLAEYERGEQLLQLEKCQHLFHQPCIEEWLKFRGTCPMCRSALLYSEPNLSTQETTPRTEGTFTPFQVLTVAISQQINEIHSPEPRQPVAEFRSSQAYLNSAIVMMLLGIIWITYSYFL